MTMKLNQLFCILPGLIKKFSYVPTIRLPQGNILEKTTHIVTYTDHAFQRELVSKQEKIQSSNREQGGLCAFASCHLVAPIRCQWIASEQYNDLHQQCKQWQLVELFITNEFDNDDPFISCQFNGIQLANQSSVNWPFVACVEFDFRGQW